MFVKPYTIVGDERPHMNGRSLVIADVNGYRFRYTSTFSTREDARRFCKKVEGAIRQLGVRVLNLDHWDEVGY